MIDKSRSSQTAGGSLHGGAAVTLDQVRAELAKMLELARAGEKAVDPTARAFSSGRATGIEDAIKLINKVLQAEHAKRINPV